MKELSTVIPKDLYLKMLAHKKKTGISLKVMVEKALRAWLVGA